MKTWIRVSASVLLSKNRSKCLVICKICRWKKTEKTLPHQKLGEQETQGLGNTHNSSEDMQTSGKHVSETGWNTCCSRWHEFMDLQRVCFGNLNKNLSYTLWGSDGWVELHIWKNSWIINYCDTGDIETQDIVIRQTKNKIFSIYNDEWFMKDSMIACVIQTGKH